MLPSIDMLNLTILNGTVAQNCTQSFTQKATSTFREVMEITQSKLWPKVSGETLFRRVLSSALKPSLWFLEKLVWYSC